MKKFLAILVLGLLITSCVALGGKTHGGGKGNIAHKDTNRISIGWDDSFFNVDFGRQIAANHCRKHGKYAFYFYDNHAGVDGAGLWFCSRTYLASSPVSGNNWGWNNYGKISLPTEPEKTEPKKTEPKKIKPETKITATDTMPPIIEIAEQITVNDPEYVLEGRVTDKDTNKVPYLTVNNSPVNVNPDGRFKISRFSVDDEELTLVAIDEFNNKTTKIVKVKVDVKEVVVAKTYDQLQPSMVKGIKNNNRIAIIIGVEKYAYTPVEALYANRDAKVFKVYANKGLGIASSNIKLLVDNAANRINTIAALKTWLPNKIIPDQSELFIFFAGHGLASDDGKELYLIPQDGNIRLLAESALSQKYIIEQIQKLKPKSVTMFFDSCYSGQARDDQILVAGLRPIIIKAEEQEVPANFNIFSASNFDQTSGSINEVQHGIFSYWLMKAMEGKADDNQDKQITNGELIAYLKTNVSKEAFNQNREQDPMLVGDANQVLMKYR